MLDTKALAQATATIIREHLAPVMDRLDALEARAAAIPEKGEPGAPGRDGKDADLDEVRALIDTAVEQAIPAAVDAAIAALPVPEKGEPGEPGAPGEKGERGDPGRDGANGRDGVGLSDALIDREGDLVLTMTDGRMKNLGRIVGKDGQDGRPGDPGKDGRDGDPGRDGRDGRDVDDIAVTQDGATLEFAFLVGETRSVFEIEMLEGPAGRDGRDAYPGEAKGLFDPEASYRALDLVTHNGSEWRARHDDPGVLPGPGWMLSACRGKRGEPGRKGDAGAAAPTVAALYTDAGQLVLTLSDGQEFKVALADLLHRFSTD